MYDDILHFFNISARLEGKESLHNFSFLLEKESTSIVCESDNSLKAISKVLSREITPKEGRIFYEASHQEKVETVRLDKQRYDLEKELEQRKDSISTDIKKEIEILKNEADKKSHGVDLPLMSSSLYKKFYKDTLFLYPDPLNHFNPEFSIYNNLKFLTTQKEVLNIENDFDSLIKNALEQLSITQKVIHSYPKELSPFELQKMIFLRILIFHPPLIIAYDPLRYLSPSEQSFFIAHLKQINSLKRSITLYLTNNIRTAKQLNFPKIITVFEGHKMEEAKIEKLFNNPLSPYSKGLIELNYLQPNDLLLKNGSKKFCPLLSRCPRAVDICSRQFPPAHSTPFQTVFCHNPFKEEEKETTEGEV